jgi:hypothetical protein
MGTLLAAKGDPKLVGCFTDNAEVLAAERYRAKEAYIQEQLRVYRQILYDLALHYLEPLGGIFPRLAYLASLRDATTNSYAHERLAAAYGTGPVGETLAKCHEELFERLLEMPLSQQERDLRLFIGPLPEGSQEGVRVCQRRIGEWIPAAAPDYLKELFRSNVAALLEMLRERNPKVRSSK